MPGFVERVFAGELSSRPDKAPRGGTGGEADSDSKNFRHLELVACGEWARRFSPARGIFRKAAMRKEVI